jgi:hypothetical protein
VFSTIFKKQIVVRPSGPKVVDYLTLCGMEDRIYKDGMDYEAFEKMVEQKIDYQNVFSILRPIKDKSLMILTNAIAKET